MYRVFLKRVIDFLGALFLIILLSPVFFVISLIIFLSDFRNPFFIQKRPGLNEKIFNLYKFRSMNNKCDSSLNLLPPVDRITPIGKIIRKLSIDELPQLFNILLGNMSFIGPRPLLIEYLTLYNDRQKERHSIRPGVTGLAQVNGRNSISWEDKFEFDLKYIKTISFALDFEIAIRTVFKVLSFSGVNASKDYTMKKFEGNK